MKHLALLLIPTLAFAQPKPAIPKPGPGDEMLRAYFRAEVLALEEKTHKALARAEDWNARRGEYRKQLAEMLGLLPAPEKTDLKATITGTLDHELFRDCM
jgi:hypothetical protein